MKNLIKLLSISVISMLFVSGFVLAQNNNEKSISKKGCNGGCCSSKSQAMLLDHSHIMKLKSADKNNDGVVYECPMKCEAPKDEVGECSKCGMNLKEVSLKDYKEKMKHNSHGMKKHKQMKDMDSKDVLNKLDKNKDGKLYQCPMKCEVPQDDAGKCSKCGMHLKEVEIEKLN